MEEQNLYNRLIGHNSKFPCWFDTQSLSGCQVVIHTLAGHARLHVLCLDANVLLRLLQSSKKRKVVRDPNLRLQMCEYHNLSNNSFLSNKSYFEAAICSIAVNYHKINFDFLQNLVLIVRSDGLNKKIPDFSKILSGILDPRILTFWNSALLAVCIVAVVVLLTVMSRF
jgi:hypothetical protein